MKTVFDYLAPEAAQAIESRRNALVSMGKLSAGFALASVPAIGLANRAFAQTGSDPISVLNFALTLEYLEDSYYRQGLASGVVPSGEATTYVQQISKHETAHVALLRGAITSAGGTPVQYDDEDFDFTAGGFDPFSDYELFLALAQGYEDTGVRAYKGQAANLHTGGGSLNPTLTVALQIHSVEARHASQVRRLRGQKGWITGNNSTLPDAFDAIYAGEQNVTQGGVDVGTVSSIGTDGITEAFDEILTDTEVLAIAGPFIVGG